MNPGQVIDSFGITGKSGKALDIVFRLPKQSDARALLVFINKVRDEADYLGTTHHETLKSETAWLKKRLEKMKQGKDVFLVALANNKVIGSCGIEQNGKDAFNHVGEFGIALLEDYTGIGIGTRFAKKVLGLARKHTKLKIISSGFFSKNLRSRKLHKKLGFKEEGLLPRGCRLKNGCFDDHVYVFKEIR